MTGSSTRRHLGTPFERHPNGKGCPFRGNQVIQTSLAPPSLMGREEIPQGGTPPLTPPVLIDEELLCIAKPAHSRRSRQIQRARRQIDPICSPHLASDAYLMAAHKAVLVLAAYGLLAGLRDDTPAVLDAVRFLPTARTERHCCQLRGRRAARLSVSAGQAA
jgi:hypothetical protein